MHRTIRRITAPLIALLFTLTVPTQLLAQGDIDDATRERILTEYLDDYRQNNRNDPELLTRILNNLGTLRIRQGRFSDAAEYLSQALEAWQQLPDYNSNPNYARSLMNLGGAYIQQGEIERAGQPLQQAIAILQKTGMEKSIHAAEVLNVLGIYYDRLGRRQEAITHHEQTIAIYEREMPDSDNLGLSYNNLGESWRALGETEKAKAYYEKALALYRNSGLSDHPSVGLVLNNLALITGNQVGGSDLAHKQLEKSLRLLKQRHGLNHPEVANTLSNLGLAHLKANNYIEAEQHLKQAEQVLLNTLGKNHPDRTKALHNLSGIYAQQEQYPQALKYARMATTTQRKRLSHQPDAVSEAKAQERKQFRYVFLNQIRQGYEVASRHPDQRDVINRQSFEVGQMARAVSTATALAQMGARLATGDPKLAVVIREHQDVSKARASLDEQLSKQLLNTKRDTQKEITIREQITKLNRQLEQIQQTLIERFPQYIELTAPQPLQVKEVQQLLKTDEALLSYVIGSSHTWLWVINQQAFQQIRIDLNRQGLNNAIQQLREDLDPYSEFGIDEFNTLLAYQLYERILKPAQPLLKGIRQLHIVPDGALQSLPLGVLVTEDPDITGEEPGQVAWLARRYAISYVPSVSSLNLLRTMAGESRAKKQFLGVGDPLLAGHPGVARGINLANIYNQRGIADVALVKSLDALPETADELKQMSQTLGADKSQLLLRETATETTLKKTNLKEYRVIAFATHGLMAGEMIDDMEPALVLTPPTRGSLQDDGLLTATEVANLELDAELAILSACNTAASDGSPEAEGFSGLSKAFFFAGTRSLLVSHWPVDSLATVELTTGLLKESAGGASYAEGLKRIRNRMMQNKTLGHPYYWAPFVLVGADR